MNRLMMIIDRYLTLVVVAVFILFVAYLLIFPLRTLEYTALPLTVTPTTVHPGDALSLGIAYCKYTSLGEQVAGQMVSQDKDRLSFPLQTVTGQTTIDRNLEEGCHTIVSKIWTVPKEAVCGHPYIGTFDITYTPNAFHTITRHSYTQAFTVACASLPKGATP